MISVEKIKAVMIGHAVGDALGVPVEFRKREELKENPVTDMIGYGTYPVPAGAWSDDTSMSLATLDSLMKNTVDYDDIMNNFVKWLINSEYTPTGQVFDVGNTCRTAIENYLQADGKTASECGLADKLSNGNGSLMRIHPMCLYLFAKETDEDEAIEILYKTSSVTHAHRGAKRACGIYAFVLWEILRNPCKAAVIRGLSRARRKFGFGRGYRVFDRIMTRNGITDESPEYTDDSLSVTEEDVKSSGYVVHTLEAAVWCLYFTSSYRECVLRAVNLGEDTDTVAAVAGGLAGALYGYDAIPEEWKNRLIRRDYIEGLCERAGLVWRKGEE